jgi:phospholipase A1/A2
MKTLLSLMTLLLGASCLSATEIVLTLMPPTRPVSPAARIPIDLVGINGGSVEMPFDAPASLSGRLASTAGDWAVSLTAEGTAPDAVAASGFAVRRYALTVPADAVGRTVLEVAWPGSPPLHAVLEVRAEGVAESSIASTPLGELGASAPVASSLARTFAGRFMPNQPIYFLYGDAAQAAKFQFSFDYRLGSLRWGEPGTQKLSTLRLGYTQRSLWDIDAASSPFYDTSYMPEVAVVTDWMVPAKGISGFTWMGLRAGYQHESNGKDGDDSRSLNRVYLRPRFILGSFEKWFLVMVPELHVYVGGLSNNPRLKDYRGYGNLQLYVSYKGGPTLRFNGWAGEKLEHTSYQLDFTYPLRSAWLNIETYFHVQYFNGYGESLRNYDRKSDAVRFGLSLVR